MIGSGAAARWARGGFLAAACTLLALAGHVVGGRGACCLPPLAAILVGGGPVGALCVALAGRMMSFRRILTVVGWAQAAFHLAFTVSTSAPAHHAAPGAHPVAPAGVVTGPSMLAGHAVAAVAASLLLAHAERALWWLYGAVFAVVLARFAVRPPAAAHRPPWPVVVADDPAPRRGVLLARAVRRRGPPVAVPHAA